MEEKHIYIILTRTTTVLSRLISRITGDKYTHASVALDENLTDMYSFGRKRIYNPLIGGFCRENLDEGLFEACKTLPYTVIQLKITQKQYDRLNTLITKYMHNAERYHYNYAGLLLAWFGKPYKSTYRFYCSEFVYSLLEQCEIVNKDPHLAVRPQDLLRFGKIIETGDWKLHSKIRKMREMSKAKISTNPLFNSI